MQHTEASNDFQGSRQQGGPHLKKKSVLLWELNSIDGGVFLVSSMGSVLLVWYGFISHHPQYPTATWLTLIQEKSWTYYLLLYVLFMLFISLNHVQGVCFVLYKLYIILWIKWAFMTYLKMSLPEFYVMTLSLLINHFETESASLWFIE